MPTAGELQAAVAQAIRNTPQFQELNPAAQAEIAAAAEVDRLTGAPPEREPFVEPEELSSRQRILSGIGTVLSSYASGLNPNIPFVDAIQEIIDANQAEADRRNEQADIRFSDARDARLTDLRRAEIQEGRAREDRQEISDRQVEDARIQQERADRASELDEAGRLEQQLLDDRQAHDVAMANLEARLQKEIEAARGREETAQQEAQTAAMKGAILDIRNGIRDGADTRTASDVLEDFEETLETTNLSPQGKAKAMEFYRLKIKPLFDEREAREADARKTAAAQARRTASENPPRGRRFNPALRDDTPASRRTIER